jgi:hypothetical protein
MNPRLQAALAWILDRLSENSTWRGIILTATGLGITINPDKMAAITATGLAMVGLINVFRAAPPSKAQVVEALDAKADKPYLVGAVPTLLKKDL